mmetsp:Transcript_41848/g.100865  ORF Transcript_41848/g.100865 Transcript_41848/m.100865 type:complete len:115 (+) Transcript_41848:2025-2369(+)
MTIQPPLWYSSSVQVKASRASPNSSNIALAFCPLPLWTQEYPPRSILSSMDCLHHETYTSMLSQPECDDASNHHGWTLLFCVSSIARSVLSCDARFRAGKLSIIFMTGVLLLPS